MKKLIAIVLAALTLAGMFAGCGAAEADPTAAAGTEAAGVKTVVDGKLTVATSPDFAPMEFVDPTKEGQDMFVGFDVTLSKFIAEELGLEVVCETSFTKDTNSDLSTQVTQCKDAGADLMFLPIYYTEASQILTYANKISYAPTFVGCDGMDGILDEGLALLTPFDANATDEATQSFVSKFVEKTGGVPNQFAADAYDGVYAVYNACVAAGVDGTTAPADVCAALVEQFNTMTFDGLTGTGMTWDENGMISKAPAAVVITDGVYVPMD